MTVKVKQMLLTPAEGGIPFGVAYQDTTMRISFRDGSSTVGLFCYSKQSPLSSEALLESRRVKISDKDYDKSARSTRSGSSLTVFHNTPWAVNLMMTITRYGDNERER